MINQTRAARGLLDWARDDRPLADRATLLPIGQYEDGSLTFAWPGFLKDAWDSAQRSYLDAGHVPVPDAAPGTKWGGPLDAFTAASIAPMAGVAGRASGAISRGFPRGSDVPFSSKNANIFDPPPRPQRPFEADYPNGAAVDETGRLKYDIDGVPLSAEYVAGRRTPGGDDVGLSSAEIESVLRKLNIGVEQVRPISIDGDAGRYVRAYGRGGVGTDRSVRISEGLPDAKKPLVLAHEAGHAIEDLAAGRFGISQDNIKKQIGRVYNTLNNPNRSRDGLEAASWGKPARP